VSKVICIGILIASLQLLACTGEPSPEPYVRHFAANSDVFDQLRDMLREESMIVEEALTTGSGGIGADRIGRFHRFDGVWYDDIVERPGLSVDTLLRQYAIAPARYAKFLELLDQTQAQVVQYKNDEGHEWIWLTDTHDRFPRFKCMALYFWIESPGEVSKRSSIGQFVQGAIALDDGWYLTYGCDV
jgi:hypothetical protein